MHKLVIESEVMKINRMKCALLYRLSVTGLLHYRPSKHIHERNTKDGEYKLLND